MLLFGWVFLVVLLQSWFSVVLAKEAFKDYKLTAVYIFKLLDHVEVRDHSGKATVCVFGDERVYATLSKIVGKKKITVSQDENVSGGCQIVYISVFHEDYDRLLAKYSDMNVATIGDAKGFAKKHGIIEFSWQADGKVKFFININRAKRKNIRINSDLLAISTVIK